VQNKDDGTHAILLVARPSKGAMDHAGMPVMLLRHSHGKMRRDGFRAAWMQPDFAVDERGRLHSAQDSFMSSCLVVKCASEGLVVTEEIIDNG
jgi:hypothetical protein